MLEGRNSTRRIQDDLTFLPLSRQRKYQIRKMREGLCIICGQPAYKGTLFCIEDNQKRGIQQPGRNRHRGKKWVIN